MDNGASSYRRFLAGDDSGLAEIVVEYKDGLILYINSYVGNLYIAEDLTEDTFFALIIKKPKFNGRSTFKSWLYAIARNITVDYIRHNSKSACSCIADMEKYLKDEQDIERSYIKEESKIVLHKALAKLNSEYRAVLWLVYFEDFSNKEVATVLKKNDRQVINLLYRAKLSLKTILEKEGFCYEE